MKIAVVGTGYVGLVSGTCFAETGNDVSCIDIDEKKVYSLQNGKITIYEPGLDTIFQRNIKQKRLSFTTNLKEGIKGAEVIFLALPTPPGEDGSADLKYILKVASDLSSIITEYVVIVDKSTVPVGTAEKVRQAILNGGADPSLFDVVSNPEFLREGVAVDDFMKPDRVVIGADNEQASKTMRKLYEPFVRSGNPIITMDIRSAELTKYAANSYLANRISFMNEIANLCEVLGADVDKVRKGMGSDTRIGKRFLFPGVGYGGSCFPKDVQALVKTASDHQYDFKILKAATAVNTKQKGILSSKIIDFYQGNLSNKTIAVWGLSFKPNTDDIREAPAIDVINALLEKGAKIKAYDPEAMENMAQIFQDKIEFTSSPYLAIKDADALAIITEWSVFRNPNFEKMKSILKTPTIFDGRNLFDIEQMRDLGFYYNSIGRQIIE